MFESLTERLQTIFSRLRGRGRLSETDVEEAMRQIRLALLEADVHYKVVKDFVAKLKERAVGSEVLESLTPAQQVVKIVNDELIALLGSTQSKLVLSSQPPTVILLVGLQGSGKTTATAKLAYHLRHQGKRPLMIAADIYRPAAVEQLAVLGRENNIDFFQGKGRPEEIVKEGLSQARVKASDVVVIDTAGRLHIDEEMMAEVVRIKELAKPHQILLVVDAMTGQDAVNVAQAFRERVDFDGLILTKLDGDARGGAALSIRAVTGRPVKFVSVGEKIDSLQLFHPERMASRILGMGDVLTLIEKAQATADEKKTRELEEKILRQQFTLEDFLEQMKQIKKMGPLSQIIQMLPGVSSIPGLKEAQVGDDQLVRVQAIIESMTVGERRNPAIISGSRRERIARGSGTTVHEINQLLKQFQQMKKLMKSLTTGFSRKIGRKVFPFM